MRGSNKKQKQIEMSSTATNVSKPNQQQKKSQQDKKKSPIYREVTVVVDSQRLEGVIESVPKMKKTGMVRVSLPTQSRTSVNFKGTPHDRAALLKLGFKKIETLLSNDGLPTTHTTKEEMVDRLLAGKPAYEEYTLAELKKKCKSFTISFAGDEKTLIARLKDYDNGIRPDIKVMNPDDDQKQTIKNRIATVVVAYTEVMRNEDTNGMDEQQQLRYVCPLRAVIKNAKHEGKPVGCWINSWKRGRSCANHGKMMDEFERNLLNDNFLSLSNATRESAINDCTFPETVALYNALVAVPRKKEESWDGVEEHDVVAESGINLSDWAMLQRKLYKDGLLSAERSTCLDRIGFEFRFYKPCPRKSYYELHSEHIKNWRCARTYIEELGSEFNVQIPKNTVVGVIKLGQFIKYQRGAFNNNGRSMMFRIDRLTFLRLGLLADATSFGPANIQTDNRLMKGMVRNSNAERQRNQEVPTNHDDGLFKTAGDVGATKRAATPNSNNRVSLAATASSRAMMEEIEAQGGAADAPGETEVAAEDNPIVNGMVDQALANIMASLPVLPPIGRDDEPTQAESSTYASQLETSNATDIFESQVGSTPTKTKITCV